MTSARSESTRIDKPASPRRRSSAQAYTVGTNVVFAPGQYAPRSPSTNALLAHELAHVVQQSAAQTEGRSLAISSPGDTAEREAHAARDAYLAGVPYAQARSRAAGDSSSTGAALRQASLHRHRRRGSDSNRSSCLEADPGQDPGGDTRRHRRHRGHGQRHVRQRSRSRTGKAFGWTAQSNLGAQLRLPGQGDAKAGAPGHAAGHGVSLAELHRRDSGYRRLFSRRRRRLLGQHGQQLHPRKSGYRHGSHDGHDKAPIRSSSRRRSTCAGAP